jgi:hypothetical protein
MGALRGYYGNRDGSNQFANGFNSSCNRGAYLLLRGVLRLLLAFWLHASIVYRSDLCCLCDACGLPCCCAAHQQKPIYVRKSTGDLDTFCAHIRVNIHYGYHCQPFKEEPVLNEHWLLCRQKLRAN